MVRRVVVTGVGMVTPAGADRDSTWDAIQNGRSGIRSLGYREQVEGLPVDIGGLIDRPDPNDLVDDEVERAHLDKVHLFGLSATAQAWQQSGLPDRLDEEAAARAGAIMGVGLAGYNQVLADHVALNADGPEAVSPFSLDALTSNGLPAYIARRYNLHGASYTTISACTSGGHAVGESFLQIRNGRADLMVCGGTEAGVNALTVAGFGAMRALTSSHNDDPTGASKPFDKNRDGFVLAEGSGVLILEEREHALARGATILAEVTGYGASGDAHHITAPSEGGEGAQRCMRTALQMADLAPEQVDYINAHGTSTPMNDVNEAKAIRSVFGDHCDQGLLVSSTKSMTGHLLGGAGGVEAVISVLAIRDQIAPPTINVAELDPEVHLDVVPHKARSADISTALSNAFGFGGTNASLLFARPASEDAASSTT